jgi:hypothetical protein
MQELRGTVALLRSDDAPAGAAPLPSAREISDSSIVRGPAGSPWSCGRAVIALLAEDTPLEPIRA